MLKVLLTKEEVQMLCEAVQAHLEAAEENLRLSEALDWRRIASKLYCSLKETPLTKNDLP